MDAYVNALVKDIKCQIDFFNIKDFSTVYIGGGTPSVLGVKRVNFLLDELRFFLRPDTEFTIEANPESADDDFLRACKNGGVNRLSLGVQTFYEPSRNAVNRGKCGDLLKRLSKASAIFPGAFCADIITGLPYQSEKTVLDDVRQLLEFSPAHISLYSLTPEKDTPLEKKIKTKEVTLPKSGEEENLWLAARGELENSGFEHYEVSNFALRGKRCVHNTRYWLMDSWLGAGSAASGTVIDEENASAVRYTYPPDADSYIRHFSSGEPRFALFNRSPNGSLFDGGLLSCETLEKNSLMRDFLMMGYRYREGPDRQKFTRIFGLGIEDCIGGTISRWRNRGFFDGENPSGELMLFLNSFLSEAFLELDEKEEIPKELTQRR